MREAENWPFPIQGYRCYDEMIESESKKPRGEQIDYALIVTPNHVHFDPAKKLLEAGIPVMCEKPLTMTVEEADELVRLVRGRNIPFCTAHTYIGHWTTRLSQFIVRGGLLGEIRWVDAYYLQGWLFDKAEDKGVLQAEWRVDPKRAGASGCGGDIGTHALMQLRYCTGLEIRRLAAFLETFLPNRLLDDHFTAYAELSNGGRALIRASQISVGHKNNCGIEIVGTKGSLRWVQEEAEKISIHLAGEPDLVYWRGCVRPADTFLKDVPAELLAEITLPSGHVEAHHDAFARLHRTFEADVRAYQEGKPLSGDGIKYANVEDGRTGVYFISKAVASSRNGGTWIDM